MGALRLVIVLVCATMAAVGLAFVVRHMTAAKPSAQAAVRPERPMIRVLVAKRDLAIGDRLKPEDVAWQSWPQGGVNPAFVTGGPVDPKQNLAKKAEVALQVATSGDPAVQALSGSLVREAVLTNEPISARKLVRAGQGGFLAVKLPAGMRAMNIPVTVDTGVGGFALPGDHVDVIQNVKMSGGGGDLHGPSQPVQSKTILTNLTLLAIDQAIEPKAGASTLVGVTATLQVPAQDIDVLAKAKEEGTLMLALRSYADMTGPQGAAEPVPVLHRPVRSAAVRSDDAVRLYRGVKVSELKVP